jgi:hypothetical protein
MRLCVICNKKQCFLLGLGQILSVDSLPEELEGFNCYLVRGFEPIIIGNVGWMINGNK